MNYLVMDRASDAVAHDLAEVRKLIEGMSALVNQQQQHQPHLTSDPSYLSNNNDPNAAVFAAAAAALAATTGPSSTLTAATSASTPGDFMRASTTTPAPASVAGQTSAMRSSQNQPTTTAEISTTAVNGNTPDAIVIQVDHLFLNQTRYFQLTSDATIEPLIAWLRVVFGDNSVSGMVLQYKGYDGLWKCLLNRDDSLRRVLKQAVKNKEKAPVPFILHMRVPREQDLLSSGYTDRRLIALTNRDS